VGQTFIGVSATRAPTLRAVIDDYARRTGLDLKPDHQAENLAMAISLVASTGGVSLLPLYAIEPAAENGRQPARSRARLPWSTSSSATTRPTHRRC